MPAEQRPPEFADQPRTARLGELQLQELTVAGVDRLIKSVARNNGAGAAKSTKSVLSSVFGLAVRRNALRVNPTRDIEKIARPRKMARALSSVEAAELVTALRVDEMAIRQDLPDLVEFMLGTGMRIGEALSMRPATIDLDNRVIEINGTVIREKGVGLRIQDNPKSKAGWRMIAVPDYVVRLVSCRLGGASIVASGLIFS